jgi:hypothetical protein
LYFLQQQQFKHKPETSTLLLEKQATVQFKLSDGFNATKTED